MSDQPKSLREQVREAKAEARERYERQRKEREDKLRAALTNYFLVKTMEEVDMVMSDSVASSIAEVQGGVKMSLDIPPQVVEDAREAALERLKAQEGYEVKWDEEEPGVYYWISRKEPDEEMSNKPNEDLRQASRKYLQELCDQYGGQGPDFRLIIEEFCTYFPDKEKFLRRALWVSKLTVKHWMETRLAAPATEELRRAVVNKIKELIKDG